MRVVISSHLDDIVRNKKFIGINDLRDVQDEIYLARRESIKVPNFFFRWHRIKFTTVIEEYIAEINTLYNS
jgi:hypothetical protein